MVQKVVADEEEDEPTEDDGVKYAFELEVAFTGTRTPQVAFIKRQTGALDSVRSVAAQLQVTLF